MKIHLQIDDDNGQWTTTTLFLDDVRCGVLCVPTDKFVALHQIMGYACSGIKMDEFVCTGRLMDVPERIS